MEKNTAHCNKCKLERTIKNIEIKAMKNGMNYMQGICETCNSKVVRVLPKTKKNIEKEVEESSMTVQEKEDTENDESIYPDSSISSMPQVTYIVKNEVQKMTVEECSIEIEIQGLKLRVGGKKLPDLQAVLDKYLNRFIAPPQQQYQMQPQAAPAQTGLFR